MMRWFDSPILKGPAHGIVILAALGLASDPGTSPATAELRHLGGGPLDDRSSIRMFSVDESGSPFMLHETRTFPSPPASWVVVHDGLYVADGSEIHRHDQQRPDLPATSSWTAEEDIVALADGPRRGLVLVLDARALSLVRFPDTGSPRALWSYPLTGTLTGPTTGRPLLRCGNYVYVADPGLPGVRVLSLDPESGPQEIATFGSDEGPVHAMAMWGKSLALLTPAGATFLDVGATGNPVFSRLGSYETAGRANAVALDSKRAFLADGADLLVLDLDPASGRFLTEPVGSWAAPTDIRAIQLDRNGRAYVLLEDSWEVLDVSAFR